MRTLWLVAWTAACAPAPEAPVLTFWPPSAGVGTTASVRVQADRAAFGDVGLDLGPGVTVDTITVTDEDAVEATVSIAADAELGPRDVGLTGDLDARIPSAWTLVAASFQVAPASARVGELREVALTGRATAWAPGQVWPDFGAGVRVDALEVQSPTDAVARIAVDPAAVAGPRDVGMVAETGAVTAWGAFTVRPGAITATWEPDAVWQGETVDFELVGAGTTWAPGLRIAFWHPDGGENPDIELQELTVVDATHAFGQVRLSNAARVGSRDLVVSIGDEALLVPDAFEVLDAPPDLSRIYVETAFDVTREVDPLTCAVTTAVDAWAWFVVPLDPPCGDAAPPAAGPVPFDHGGVFPAPPEAAANDCPVPETVSAGEVVRFEADNVVPLVRRVQGSNGTVIYEGVGLTAADYGFGQRYALVAPGDPAGLGALSLPDVQPTVPADFTLLTPALCGLEVDRAAGLPLAWTPAGTYPDALLRVALWGTVEATGGLGYAGTIPWDDGASGLDPADLLQLQRGPATLSVESYVRSGPGALPEGIFRLGTPESSVRTIGGLTLR